MNDSDNAWVLVAAAPVLLMTPGFVVVVKVEQVNNVMKAIPNGPFTGKIGGGKIFSYPQGRGHGCSTGRYRSRSFLTLWCRC